MRGGLVMTAHADETPEAATATATTTTMATTRAGRILIVEDESNILEALSFILSRAGWDVRGHGKGESALAEVARLSPDILVLDVMLPGRSGFDILRELRADTATAQLPVLMLTAKGQAKDRELAMALGANAFLTKPFSNTELLEVVAQMSSAPHAPGGAGEEG